MPADSAGIKGRVPSGRGTVRLRGRAILLILLPLALCQAGSAQVRDLVGTGFNAHVTSVIDGDTVDLVPAGEKRAIRVRIEGVDAPERGEPFSDAARRMARVMLFDRRARVEGRDVDRYGRLVARLVVDGKDASVELVKAGLACHFVAYSSDAALAAMQAQARREGRGFWAPGAARPRCTRAQRPVAGRARTGSGAPSQSAPATRAQEGFHGNTSSHVYHAPSCPNYNCRNCTRVFRSEREAQAAGFTPARDCLRR